MKRFRLIFLSLMVTALLLVPSAAFASPVDRPQLFPFIDDKVVVGENFTLLSGEVLNGTLLVMGGSVSLQENSIVQGDVVAFGASVDVQGEIMGSLVLVGSSVSLGETAVVKGDMVSAGGSVSRTAGSTVYGDVVTERGATGVDLPRVPDIPVPSTPSFRPTYFPNPSSYSTSIFWILFRSFAISALAVLLVMFMPDHAKRTSQAVLDQPVVTGGMGLLTIFVVLPISVILMITVLLIPLILLGYVLLAFAALFGWISLGYEVGVRLGQSVGQEWTPIVEAGAGTFLLTLIVGSAGIVPCLGVMIWILVLSFGLGAVILTRFGRQPFHYNPSSSVALPPPVLPADQTEEKPAPQRKPKKKKEE